MRPFKNFFCTCMCVYTYTYTYIQIYTHTHSHSTSIDTYTYTYMYMYMIVHVHVYLYLDTCISKNCSSEGHPNLDRRGRHVLKSAQMLPGLVDGVHILNPWLPHTPRNARQSSGRWSAVTRELPSSTQVGSAHGRRCYCDSIAVAHAATQKVKQRRAPASRRVSPTTTYSEPHTQEEHF